MLLFFVPGSSCWLLARMCNSVDWLIDWQLTSLYIWAEKLEEAGPSLYILSLLFSLSARVNSVCTLGRHFGSDYQRKSTQKASPSSFLVHSSFSAREDISQVSIECVSHLAQFSQEFGPPSSSSASSTWICAWRPNGQTRENVRCVCIQHYRQQQHTSICFCLPSAPEQKKKILFDPGRRSFLGGDGGRTRERVCSGRREALERESFSQLRYYFRFSKLHIVMYIKMWR